MNIFKNTLVTLIVAILSLIANVSYAQKINVTPDIETIMSGPMKTNAMGNNYRYRIVVTLSEVTLDIYLQKIEYGDENCCVKVAKTIHIDSRKFKGAAPIYEVDSIEWTSYNSLKLKVNALFFHLKDIDASLKVEKE